MTINEQIESFLIATFKLPVVYDVGQSKVENCISYYIEDVKVFCKQGQSQKLELGITVLVRANSGYELIGYLSHGLANSNARNVNDSLYIANISTGEKIEQLNKTEVITSKQLTVFLTSKEDAVSERIKFIEIRS